MILRLETDDNPRPFLILTIKPTGGSYTPDSTDKPYGYTNTIGAAQVTAGTTYPTTGATTQITLDLATVCSPFPAWRVISAQTVGAVTVSRLRVSNPIRVVTSGFLVGPGRH